MTATAVFKIIDPAESKNSHIYSLKDDYDRTPEFSHDVGEPIVEKQ